MFALLISSSIGLILAEVNLEITYQSRHSIVCIILTSYRAISFGTLSILQFRLHDYSSPTRETLLDDYTVQI